MELAYISGEDRWVIFGDNHTELYSTHEYWDAQDKFDQLLSDE